MSTNKTIIIDKLWNDRGLSTEEITYISKNIKDDTKPLIFDHTNKDAYVACGISAEDVEEFNEKFSELATKDPVTYDTELVERMESFATDPRYLRIITMQCAEYAIIKNSPKARKDPWK